MDSNTHSTQPWEPPDPSDGRTGLPELPGLPEGSEELREVLERSKGLPELAELPAGLAGLPAAVAELETEDLDQLTDTALDAELLELQRWADRLHGQWLRRLAAVDARGPPELTKASKPPRPRGGWGGGCGWGRGRPARPSTRPGPCSGVRCPRPPMRWWVG